MTIEIGPGSTDSGVPSVITAHQTSSTPGYRYLDSGTGTTSTLYYTIVATQPGVILLDTWLSTQTDGTVDDSAIGQVYQGKPYAVIQMVSALGLSWQNVVQGVSEGGRGSMYIIFTEAGQTCTFSVVGVGDITTYAPMDMVLRVSDYQDVKGPVTSGWQDVDTDTVVTTVGFGQSHTNANYSYNGHITPTYTYDLNNQVSDSLFFSFSTLEFSVAWDATTTTATWQGGSGPAMVTDTWRQVRRTRPQGQSLAFNQFDSVAPKPYAAGASVVEAMSSFGGWAADGYADLAGGSYLHSNAAGDQAHAMFPVAGLNVSLLEELAYTDQVHDVSTGVYEKIFKFFDPPPLPDGYTRQFRTRLVGLEVCPDVALDELAQVQAANWASLGVNAQVKSQIDWYVVAEQRYAVMPHGSTDQRGIGPSSDTWGPYNFVYNLRDASGGTDEDIYTQQTALWGTAGGPEEFVSRATHLCTYDGQSAGSWVSVPQELIDTARQFDSWLYEPFTNDIGVDALAAVNNTSLWFVGLMPMHLSDTAWNGVDVANTAQGAATAAMQVMVGQRLAYRVTVLLQYQDTQPVRYFATWAPSGSGGDGGDGGGGEPPAASGEGWGVLLP